MKSPNTGTVNLTSMNAAEGAMDGVLTRNGFDYAAIPATARTREMRLRTIGPRRLIYI
jgi:hypothetical protein